MSCMRIRQCGARLAVLVWLVSGALGFDAASLCGREPGSTEAETGIADFRRVFVPADSPETWPVGAERYLPISNAEFARLTRIQQEQRSDSSPVAVRIQGGAYRAELHSEANLQVKADLDVSIVGTEPQLLPIAPFNFAIQSAIWQGPSKRQAIAGLWKQGSAKLTPAVLVEQSGMLRIDGLLPASTISDDRVEYLFKTPSIVPVTFELTLPTTYSVEVSNAERMRMESASLGKNRWLFQLAPYETHRIELRRVREILETRTPPLASQSTYYQLSSTGIEFVTELLVENLESTRSTVRAVLPAGTRVVDVTLDQESVEWNVVADQGRQYLAMELTEADSPRLVRIRSLAKLRVDSTWELPKLRFDAIAWTEGTSRLLISPDLELQSLKPIQCTLQHIVGITADVSEGEVYRFQNWSPEAAIEVKLTRPKPKLDVQTVTSVEVATGEAQGKVVANLTNSRGAVYQAQAVVASGWRISSVTTSPPSALRDWHVNRADTSSILHCQLNRPVTAQHPVRISIEGRNTTGELQLPSTVGRFRVLRFLEVNSADEWLNLGTAQSDQLVLADKHEDTSIDSSKSATSIPVGFLDALPERKPNRFIDISGLSDSERIEIGRQPAQYKARVHVAIDADPDRISHSYEIEYLIESGSISELFLESSVPMPASMQWVVRDRSVEVTAKRVATDNSRATGVKYLLKFSRPLETDFQLRANYFQPIRAQERCNVLRLLETDRWTEHIQLNGALEEFEVIDQGLTPSIWHSRSERPNDLPLLGAYRVGPQDFRRENSPVKLQLKRQTTPQLVPKLTAWLGEFQTVQAANGAALHAASYYLESSGERFASLQLPAEVELQEIWLDNVQIDANRSLTEGDTYRVRLGRRDRWHQLSLKYSTRGPALAGSAIIQPVLPECSFPVNLGRWTLWAPEQYEIDNSSQRYSPERYHWWKRLFGPLARPRGESRFQPFSRTGWTSLWSTPLAVQTSKQLTGALANQLTERIRSEPQRPFGAVLAELANQNGIETLLCVDRSSMLARGLQPDTPCGKLAPNERDPVSAGLQARPLSSYQLALLASPNAIVLCTAEQAAHWYDQIRPTRVGGVYLVTSDDLADRLAELRTSRSPDYVSAADWLSIPIVSKSNWSPSERIRLADVGRQAQTVEFTQALPTLVVRQAHVNQALWYAVLLFSLVLGVWRIVRFPNCMLLVGVVAAAACLVVPPSLLTIPQAIFLGLVGAALFRTVMNSSAMGDTTRSAAERLATAILVFVIVQVSLVGDAVAQLPMDVSKKGTDQDTLPRILVPIDSDGAQQGGDVYLPEKFLEVLQGLPNQGTRGGAPAVILAAQYNARLPAKSSDVADSDAAFAEQPWTLRWKLETSVPNLRLVLPLRQDEALWLGDAHELDGLPVQLQWHPDVGRCSIVIPEPGIHWLSLVCRPRHSGSNGAKFLQLHVPPVPGASLELAYPSADVDKLKVVGAALLTSQGKPDSNQYLLSSRDTIKIRWEEDGAIANANLWERLEQSSWLFVDPAAARIEVQFHFVGRHASLQDVTLEFSDQLKLLDPGPNTPVVEMLDPDPMHPRRVRLKLGSGVPSDFTLPLTFELKRSVSIGQIYFPEVKIVGSPPELHRFAVSVSSGLSYDERGSSDLRVLEPREFLDLWNTPRSTPLFAYALDRQVPRWSLKVWPDPRTLSMRQSLQLHCSLNQVDVEFEAELKELTGYWHSHRLLVPESIRIDDIRVQQEDESRSIPLRWSRVSPTEVSVFLGKPVYDDHRISLRGHIERSRDGLVDIPQIRFADANRGEIRMDLYRTEEVELSWVSPESSPQQTNDQRIPQSAQELHVGSYSWRASEASSFSKLEIRKNQVDFETESVTTIEQAADEWRARLSSRILVQQGVLSRLVLDVPQSVQGPFQLQSGQAAVIEDFVENASGKQITVLLSEPVSAGDEVKIQLIGTLNLPVDQRLVVPSLRWLAASDSTRYVLLPTLVDGKSITWRRRGLRRQALPLRLVEFATQETRSLCFRVEQEEFEAEQRYSQTAMRRAQIRHAKITGVLDADGTLSATAEFMFQPGRASYGALQLPRNSEGLQLVIGDAPAQCVRLSDGSWRLPIGPPFLPQRILLSYRCNAKQSGDRLILDPPKILLGDRELPAAKIWWQIRAPVNLLLRTDDPALQTSARDIARASYEVPLQIVQDAFSQALDLPQEEGRAWAQTWRSIIHQAERVWQSHGSWSDEETNLLPTNETLLAVEDAFAEDGDFDPTNAEGLTYPVQQANILSVMPERQEYCFVSDSSHELEVIMTSGSQQSAWRWFAALMMIGGALAVVLQLRHRPEVYQILTHRPHSLALLVGFAWWLLLKPSAIGMLIVAFAILSMALRKWRWHRQEKSARRESQVAMMPS